MKGNKQKLFWGIMILIGLANTLQAIFTELIYDEAYYWYFSKQLDWGYFDHPPMVAAMIALGNLFFKGTLGVRIIGVFSTLGAYVLIWNTVSKTHKKHHIGAFFVLLSSMTLLNAYGFFTLPDTPLLFFTALLFYLLKSFFKGPNWGLSIALGLVMAALMYSKYHAVLVIVGVLVGVPSLLKNKYAWVAVGVSLVAYSPHLYWLYSNEFVSVAYHLFERPNRAYDFFDFGLGYFINLAAIFGFCFPFIYKSLFSETRDTALKKSLFGVIVTVLVFFFISSFNRRIQTQWMVVICIPAALLVFEALMANPKLKRQLWISGWINIILIVFLRIGLVYEPLLPISYEAHGNKAWTTALKEVVGDHKVVFENSYRNAPMYAFYTGGDTYSLNTIDYRQNQYNIDGSERAVLGEKVAYITKDSVSGIDNIPADFSFEKAKAVPYYGTWIPSFKPYSQLKIALIQAKDNSIVFALQNPYSFQIPIQEIRFGLAFLNEYKQFQYLSEFEAIELVSKKTGTVATNNLNKIVMPGETVTLKGKYHLKDSDLSMEYFKLSISANSMPFLLGANSHKLATWKLN
jgi:hypothetical protein